jgi:nucleoporin-like protein 2
MQPNQQQPSFQSTSFGKSQPIQAQQTFGSSAFSPLQSQFQPQQPQQTQPQTQNLFQSQFQSPQQPQQPQSLFQSQPQAQFQQPVNSFQTQPQQPQIPFLGINTQNQNMSQFSHQNNVSMNTNMSTLNSSINFFSQLTNNQSQTLMNNNAPLSVNNNVNNTQSFQKQQQTSLVPDKPYYSRLEELSEEDIRAFKADTFKIGQIPSIPPSREFI